MTSSDTQSEPGSASSGAAALSALGVSVEFGESRILDNVTASVRSGEIVGIVGPNGSGKTTLLRTIAGLLEPTSGFVKLDERSLADISPRDRARQIGYLPQLTGNHSFTAFEFVLMGRYPHMGRFSLEGRTDRQIASAAMERTGTAEFAGRRLDEMSGGERQRVALARLLTQQAQVLLMDEPTASLDMQHQLLTMATARAEAESGAAVAVVLHDLSLAARHCDRLIILHRGRVAADGEPWQVISSDALRRYFSVDAAVEPEPITGKPSVSLLGVADDDRSPGVALRIHLVCGAGSGRELMHRLSVDGHDVSACVLGEGDADRETALRLGIEHIAAPPFSTISLEQDAEHRRLVRLADVVVICEMAVGPGNLRNLEAATEARQIVMLKHDPGAKWDHTGGVAASIRQELEKRAQVLPRNEVVEAVSMKD